MVTKKLYRSRKDRIIGGVCGGIAEYFNIDPVLVRIIAVLTILINGIGIIAYIIAWIIIPQEPDQKPEKEKSGLREKAEEIVQDIGERIRKGSNSDRKRSNAVVALILISLGILFLLNNFLPRFNFGRLWPLILVVIGLAILAQGSKKKDAGTSSEAKEKPEQES
ncbi:PspC domain-containing protein [Candidatus Aerophobetes bacterium]|uniref:PspC domain-containing protein n=1 Tax=Aerophobetes bacterium TaxID=2030807 RepID=A0A497E484_UNCAE|nr:MAG: PspC domain-containing protein [Candidatus Aerophobetes bacterium]